jgi:hypothetical protein
MNLQEAIDEAVAIVGDNQGLSPLASRLYMGTVRKAPAGYPSAPFDDRCGRSL